MIVKSLPTPILRVELSLRLRLPPIVVIPVKDAGPFTSRVTTG